MPAGQAAGSQLSSRDVGRGDRRAAPRSALAVFLANRAVVAALARAAGSHAHPEARRGGVHAAQRRGVARARAGAGAGPVGAVGGAGLDGAALRLRPAVLDLRHLPNARRPARPAPRPARLVAPDGEDVRVRRPRGGRRCGESRGGRVPGLRARADRGAACVSAGGHGERPGRGARRGRAAVRRRDRQHRDRPAERGSRGERQHTRQRNARLRASPRTVAASGRGRRGCAPPRMSRRLRPARR